MAPARRRTGAVVVAGALALAAAWASRPAANYTDPHGPRYAGAPVAAFPDPAPHELRVVTLNVRFANRPDAAARLLRTHPDLAPADLVALEEMDAGGAEAIAAALGMWWVYYPATVHPRAGALGTGSDFGNALLARWPIRADRKLILPGRSFPRRMQRTATVADVAAPDGLLRVYALHLETPIAMLPGGREEQVRAVVADARGESRVVVMGDMNAHARPGRVFTSAGFSWPTAASAPTVSRFAWDHVFTRGLPAATAQGVVDAGEASDHRAVFVAFPLSTAPRTASPPTPPAS